MSESRGKRTRKGRWQLTLGVKETIFSLVGITGLMMMSFAVGTLAGRGDIYRVLYNWGFLGPEAAKAVQPWNFPPQMAAPPSIPAAAPATQLPGAAVTTAAPVNPAGSAPLQGSIAGPVSTPAAAPPTAKKNKAATASTNRHKNKEEELRQLREEVAKKLKFQNSLDTATYKPSRNKAKPGEKAPATTLVRVGKFRDKKSAQARVTELQKKGAAVSLKEGKDEKGPYYMVYQKKSASPPQTASAAPNKPKGGGTKLKTKGE